MMQLVWTGFLVLLAANVFAESRRVVIETSHGEIVVELDQVNAPVSVANFLKYVDEGAYDGTIFSRVIADFMVQGGGLRPDMSAMPEGDAILNEADNGLFNLAGTIAMARVDEIDSARREFYINIENNPHLDHSPQSCTRAQMRAWSDARAKGLYKPLTCKSFGYAVFGSVIAGMEVVQRIESEPTHMSMGFSDVPIQTVMINSIKRLPDIAEE